MAEISLIIPVYNKGKYLKEAISSAFDNVVVPEIIVIDDCSTDNSLRILEELQQEYSTLKVIRNTTNQGANCCRNLGVREATSELIVFFDADDILFKGALDLRISFMQHHPEMSMAVSSMATFFHELGDHDATWIPRKSQALERFMKHDLPWQTMQPTWRKVLVAQSGGFRENFSRLQDVEFHTRILSQYAIEWGVISSKPDCALRIAEERMPHDPTAHMKQVIDSLNKYVEAFRDVNPRASTWLRGSVYAVYVRLLVFRHQAQIDPNAAIEMSSSLKDLMSSLGAASIIWLMNFRSWIEARGMYIRGFDRVCGALIYAL